MNRTLSLALAALLASAGGAAAQEKFTFALNWFAVGDHAAYWVALDKGYYKAKGLDVTLENSKGSGDSIAKVDTGRADAGLLTRPWSSPPMHAARRSRPSAWCSTRRRSTSSASRASR